jgi:UDP-N-acetylmuramoylalanine--D-glutamate ligase
MQTFDERRVTIIGMAREGTALARFLAREGARVTVSDMKGVADLAEEIGQLAGLPIQCVLRGHPEDILEADVLFVSPGVPREIPILQEAERRGLPLSSETELLFSLCPAPIIGITGSSGKTTTTTLIGEMMKVDRRRKVWVGGNIGRPLIEHVEEMKPGDWVVLELSSFQLEHLRHSPHVSVVTNLRPNHLDRHPSYEAYKAAKANILRYQSADDVAVLNWDDLEVRAMAHLTEARVRWFSRQEQLEEGTCVVDGWVVVRHGGREEQILPVEDLALPGDHNLENVLAAISVVTATGLKGASAARVAESFQGVPHRLELVREQDGVRWMNDSIATSPDRLIAALRAFDGEPIVLLAGGRDKHLPMEEMAREIAARVRCLITFGEAGSLVREAVMNARARMNGNGQRMRIIDCQSLEEAVEQATGLAKAGDVVLLSPGGTSFDKYRDFDERGRHFRELVNTLAPQREKQAS